MFQSLELFGIPVYLDHVELDKHNDINSVVQEHVGNYVYKTLQVNSSKHKLVQQEPATITALMFLNQERNCNILFHKAWTNVFPKQLQIEYLGMNATTVDDWNYSPRRGDLMIFPSHLKFTINSQDFKQFDYTLTNTN